MTTKPLLAMVIPVSLMPVAVAGSVGAWRLRSAFEAIAASGAGGVGAVLGPSAGWAESMLIGVSTCAVALAAALVASRRQVVTQAPDAAATRRHVVFAVTLVALVLSSGWLVRAAERSSVMLIGRMSGMLSVPPPPAAEGARALSTAAYLQVLERDVIGSIWGGLVILVAAGTMAVVVARGWRFGRPIAPTSSLVPAAVAIAILGAWAAFRLLDAVAWLRQLG